MRRLTSTGAALVLLGLSSCGSSSSAGSCDEPASPAVFELGTGEACFERLTALQTVPEIQGPQGGFHVWAGLGCSDCGTKAIVEFGTKNAKTKAWLLGNPEKQAVDLGQGAWGQHAGLTAFLPGDTVNAPDEKLPKGTHVILAMRVLDSMGKELHSAEVEVVLGDLEMWSSCSSDAACGTSGFAPCCAR
jgi:hypothetical protein